MLLVVVASLAVAICVVLMPGLVYTTQFLSRETDHQPIKSVAGEGVEMITSRATISEMKMSCRVNSCAIFVFDTPERRCVTM